MKKRLSFVLTYCVVLLLANSIAEIFLHQKTRYVFSAEKQYPTKYVDELNLSLTECGWNSTQARKSVDGNPISINGKKFDRGVGHHPPGSISILVPPVKGRFTAYVGIDDETNGAGHAEFLVYGDGKLLWRSDFLVGKEDAKFCDVPFEGITKLVLKVDEGPEGYGHDHTDWADAK
ncbi:MAG: NPCBM/NEW2 domain-containing protein, partial [Thermoguttaceae bacterium]